MAHIPYRTYKLVAETFISSTENKDFMRVFPPPPFTVCNVRKRFIPWESAWTAQVNLTETLNVIIKTFYIKALAFALY